MADPKAPASPEQATGFLSPTALQQFFAERVATDFEKMEAAKAPQVTLIVNPPEVRRGMAGLEFAPGVDRKAIQEAYKGRALISSTRYFEMLHEQYGMRVTTPKDFASMQQDAKTLARMAADYAKEHNFSAVVAVDMADALQVAKEWGVGTEEQPPKVALDLRVALPRATEVAYGHIVAGQMALGNMQLTPTGVLEVNASKLLSRTPAQPSAETPSFQPSRYNTDATRRQVATFCQAAITASIPVHLVDGDNVSLFGRLNDAALADPSRFARLLEQTQGRGTTLAGYKQDVLSWDSLSRCLAQVNRLQPVDRSRGSAQPVQARPIIPLPVSVLVTLDQADQGLKEYSETCQEVFASSVSVQMRGVPQPGVQNPNPTLVMLASPIALDGENRSQLLDTLLAAQDLPANQPSVLIDGPALMDAQLQRRQGRGDLPLPPVAARNANDMAWTAAVSALRTGWSVVMLSPLSPEISPEIAYAEVDVRLQAVQQLQPDLQLLSPEGVSQGAVKPEFRLTVVVPNQHKAELAVAQRHLARVDQDRGSDRVLDHAPEIVSPDLPGELNRIAESTGRILGMALDRGHADEVILVDMAGDPLGAEYNAHAIAATLSMPDRWQGIRGELTIVEEGVPQAPEVEGQKEAAALRLEQVSPDILAQHRAGFLRGCAQKEWERPPSDAELARHALTWRKLAGAVHEQGLADTEGGAWVVAQAKAMLERADQSPEAKRLLAQYVGRGSQAEFARPVANDPRLIFVVGTHIQGVLDSLPKTPAPVIFMREELVDRKEGEVSVAGPAADLAQRLEEAKDPTRSVVVRIGPELPRRQRLGLAEICGQFPDRKAELQALSSPASLPRTEDYITLLVEGPKELAGSMAQLNNALQIVQPTMFASTPADSLGGQLADLRRWMHSVANLGVLSLRPLPDSDLDLSGKTTEGLLPVAQVVFKDLGVSLSQIRPDSYLTTDKLDAAQKILGQANDKLDELVVTQQRLDPKQADGLMHRQTMDLVTEASEAGIGSIKASDSFGHVLYDSAAADQQQADQQQVRRIMGAALHYFAAKVVTRLLTGPLDAVEQVTNGLLHQQARQPSAQEIVKAYCVIDRLAQTPNFQDTPAEFQRQMMADQSRLAKQIGRNPEALAELNATYGGREQAATASLALMKRVWQDSPGKLELPAVITDPKQVPQAGMIFGETAHQVFVSVGMNRLVGVDRAALEKAGVTIADLSHSDQRSKLVPPLLIAAMEKKRGPMMN